MKNINIPIIGAVITALLSTLCCLPALLFLVFGISSGVLTSLTTLEYVRIPMGILTVLLLVYGIKRYSRRISCKCEKKKTIATVFTISSTFALFGLMLFYPEIIPMFMD